MLRRTPARAIRSARRALTAGLAGVRPIGSALVILDEQTVDDEPNVPFGGVLGSGTGARFAGAANLDAFTDTRTDTRWGHDPR